MEIIDNQIFSGCDVQLDNKQFRNCKFFGCRLLFHADGLFATEDCGVDGYSILCVHQDVLTIVDALSLLPKYGAGELFSIISAYIEGKSSPQDCTRRIRERSSRDVLFTGKIYNSIEVLRGFRESPTVLSTGDFVDHMHLRIDLNDRDCQREASSIRDGAKYVYLPWESYVDTWVNGGTLPIPLLSSHLGDRAGSKTPDETGILASTMPKQRALGLMQSLGIQFDGPMRGVGVRNCTLADGTPIEDIFIEESRSEDCIGLCFANSLSGAIAAGFGRKICVRIEDFEAFKSAVDKELGTQGISGDCKYTIDHNRNHFLKHIQDAWQDEHRIIWPALNKKTEVELPSGLASVVPVPEYKNASLEEFKRISTMFAQQLAAIDKSVPFKRPVPIPFAK